MIKLTQKDFLAKKRKLRQKNAGSFWRDASGSRGCSALGSQWKMGKWGQKMGTVTIDLPKACSNFGGAVLDSLPRSQLLAVLLGTTNLFGELNRIRGIR
ncbi:MAG: hypothetical protein A2942_00865 [Candidatus Lloydbacteria bacterium RIFCSPLOWO2_01_FULL_50_20]|uniref:Uncharacterized protein n=1 Tax=Candidatus Lloydbacteria bacterium RIFCSPLOWO2_01_FULL_50_20 TaxID=1798665 RepID=A0A1G2DFS5_9BACT|nr:MAG: hypothetical protein A2942_00865 [Candidatus Lloydbacteria bacterium RIFCSPLOWO2_01_FULL_50_20]